MTIHLASCREENIQRNRTICELRGKHSAAETGRMVGCSRNAVIGVWYRNGLCDPIGHHYKWKRDA